MRMRLSGGKQVAAEAEVADAAIAKTGATAEATGRKATTGIRRSLTSQIQAMRSIGRGMTKYVTAPILGVAAISGKFALDFDRNMRNVNSIAQLPERQFRRLKQSVLDLAGPTAQTPNTLAEGLYDLVSSGFTANEAIRILHKSALAASAGLTTTEVSTKAVAAALNAYHLPASRAGAVSDTLFETVNRGVLTFDDLANTIGDALPFAAQLGVNLNEVGAAIATMTKQGLSSAESVTRLKNVFIAFIKPSKGMQKVLNDIGLSGEELLQQRGFQGAMEALRAHTDGTNEAVARLFPNIRGMGGVLALTGKSAKTAGEDLEAFKNSSGATAKVLREQEKSFGFQAQRAWASLQAVLIEIGEQVLPIVVPPFLALLGTVRDTVSAFSDLPGPVKAVAGEIAILAALAGPLLMFASAALTAAKNLGILQTTQAGTTLNRGRLGRLGAGIAGVGAFSAGQAMGGPAEAIGNIAGGAALGFSAGGPWGAAIGGGFGALLTAAPAISKLISGSRELTELQKKVMAGQRSSASAVADYRKALDHLNGTQGRAHRASEAHARAVRAEHKASQHLREVIAATGRSSSATTRAQLGLARAMDRVRHSAQAERNAQRLHGNALRYFRLQTTHLIATEKARLPALRQLVAHLNKRVEKEPHNIDLLGRTVKAEDALRKANLMVTKTLAEAEAKGGKPWARSLAKMTVLQATYGKEGKTLTRSLQEQKARLAALNQQGLRGLPMWQKLREEIAKTREEIERFNNAEMPGSGVPGTKGPVGPRDKPPRHRKNTSAKPSDGSAGLRRLMAPRRGGTVTRQPVQFVVNKRVLAEGTVEVQEDEDARA